MTYDPATLKHIIDYCQNQSQEADQPPSSPWLLPDVLTGKKLAYNDVLQYARTILGDAS